MSTSAAEIRFDQHPSRATNFCGYLKSQRCNYNATKLMIDARLDFKNYTKLWARSPKISVSMKEVPHFP